MLAKVSIAHLSVGIDDEVTVVAEQVGAGVDVVRVFGVAVRRDVSVVDANLQAQANPKNVAFYDSLPLATFF